MADRVQQRFHASGGDIYEQKKGPLHSSSVHKYPGGVARRAAGAAPPNHVDETRPC